MTRAKAAPRIYALGGVNGAGKSSIGGAAIRALGGDYYNPDEAARALLAANPGLDQARANGTAWQRGRQMLERAIAGRLDFAFETTLGGNTMPRLLVDAAAQGFEVRVWYIGLATPELHIARVRQRVRQGGHPIAEADIRRRCEHSRLNLVQLLPALTALRVYDNSALADPTTGHAPEPILVLHVERGSIIAPPELAMTPRWAKPIVAASLELAARKRRR